ncbi:transaldolase family protein [Tengunoibacter tsumagoiensis]|uniref:Fructose-6-phosphate aldolase n=1 Tax=Tengunoibacter tsumagoiensis TaxID=2014871 RepID=A0A401ZUS3_9CHLR|nr:transaldolase family protein [Tengunoibacter tsumagoiensis]GCE10651.1 fructose-6-phosphate aldolase [Tengunoibacter tsumagoiensis]
MALYVDTAYLEDIFSVTRTLPLAGVTTNPTILLNAQRKGQHLTAREVAQQLLEHSNGLIFMQPSVKDEEQAYQEALDYIELAPDRIIPKIPMTEIGVRVAHRLKVQGHTLAFTAVTTISQAYTAGLIGADFIIPYYNRLIRSGVDAKERIAQMAKIYQAQQFSTRIMAASIKSSNEVAEALLHGAHDLTIPPQILLDMIRDPETEQAVEKFEQDREKLSTH